MKFQPLSSHASPPSINGFMYILVVVGHPKKKHQKSTSDTDMPESCGQKKMQIDPKTMKNAGFKPPIYGL